MADTILVLLILSSVLFVVSLFQKDRTKLVEQDVEDLSMQFFQETYKIKKRLQVLEEELLLGEPLINAAAKKQGTRVQVNEIVKNQVLALYEQGLTFEQIANQSSLAVKDVQLIIAENRG
ncbi:hypothetical protein [Heyndrickxia acidiproducens]|uniref:hypothetical protein n=1 Tax=Heyndrickxia acidiproducens TaxID=1121084 RepID=UPI000365F5D7|nr:hypothetical protein [Heyndrickxia acidiproducens]